PTPRGAYQESLLDEERLGHIFQRAALFAERCRETVDPHRATIEALDDCRQELAVESVEALAVHLEQIECRIRDRLSDPAIGAHLRVVAHAPQQAVGDPRCAARALRDAAGPALIDAHPANRPGPRDGAVRGPPGAEL